MGRPQQMAEEPRSCWVGVILGQCLKSWASDRGPRAPPVFRSAFSLRRGGPSLSCVLLLLKAPFTPCLLSVPALGLHGCHIPPAGLEMLVTLGLSQVP